MSKVQVVRPKERVKTELLSGLADPQEFTSVKGAAGFACLSEVTIRRLLTEQKLTRYRFSGRTLIKVSELRAMVRVVKP
jgi:hypothetical protein